MKAIPPALIKLATEIDERGLDFPEFEKDDAYLQLLKQGVMFPRGESFSYKGMGVIVFPIYGTEIGKVTEKLKEQEGVEVLAKRRPTMYWNGSSRPIIYRKHVSSEDYPDLTPIMDQEEDYSELGAVVFLHLGSGSLRELRRVDYQNIRDFFLSPMVTYDQRVVETIDYVLSDIRPYMIGTNGDFKGVRDINTVCRELSGEFDAITKA
jgi:hypothetical protein